MRGPRRSRRSFTFRLRKEAHTHTHTHTHTHKIRRRPLKCAHTHTDTHTDTPPHHFPLSAPLFITQIICRRLFHLFFIITNEFSFSLPRPPLYSSSFPSFVCCRFINARRRIVQPMIDQSNRAGKSRSFQLFAARRN